MSLFSRDPELIYTNTIDIIYDCWVRDLTARSTVEKLAEANITMTIGAVIDERLDLDRLETDCPFWDSPY